MHDEISRHLSQISRLTTTMELIAGAEVGDFDSLALAVGGLAAAIDHEIEAIRDVLDPRTYEQAPRVVIAGGAR